MSAIAPPQSAAWSTDSNNSATPSASTGPPPNGGVLLFQSSPPKTGDNSFTGPKRGFHFGRIDIRTGGVDHIHAPIRDEEVALLVHPAKIADADETVRGGRCGR